MGLLKKDLVCVLEIIELLRSCNTERDFREILVLVENAIGADFSVFIVGELIDGESFRLWRIVPGHYPKEWLQFYKSNDLYRIDPIIKHHTKFSSPANLSDIFKNCNDHKSRKLIDLARAIGLGEGISCSMLFSAQSNGIGIAAFIKNSDKRFESNKKLILKALIPFLSLTFLRVHNFAVNSKPLIGRQNYYI